jgi:SAM-dependent methyltransferase
MALYDTLGVGYRGTRRPDPRIAARVAAALGDAASVVNVGAGAGSYETPATILAVEPSAVMIAQRPAGAAPVVRARAEALPVAGGAADAAMALLTVHHWGDLAAGVAELRRVARRRVVVLTWDQRVFRDFWLAGYLPESLAMEDRRAVPIDRLVELLGGARVETVPVPHDCVDGFAAAFWRRPAAYLDPGVRAGMSLFGQSAPDDVARGLVRLADDLTSGAWAARHRDLLDAPDYDAGYRLLIAGG